MVPVPFVGTTVERSDREAGSGERCWPRKQGGGRSLFSELFGHVCAGGGVGSPILQ